MTKSSMRAAGTRAGVEVGAGAGARAGARAGTGGAQPKGFVGRAAVAFVVSASRRRATDGPLKEEMGRGGA